MPTLITAILLATTWHGTLTRVIDGDTIYVTRGHGKPIEKIRLQAIDAPESKQPYGKESTNALRKILGAKRLRIEDQGRGRYGRLIAHVYAGRIHVNLRMVQRGHAWVFRKYTKDMAFMVAEGKAKIARLGLWASKEPPLPPWEWRRGLRTVSPVSKECARHHCKSFKRCEDVMQYFKKCSATHLDRDKDGTPCEKLCASPG